MITVNFYLKSVAPNKKGQQPVIAQVGYNYKKVRKSIFKCKPSEWDKKKQKLKLPDVNNPNYTEYSMVNQLFDNLRSSIRDLDNLAISEKRKIAEHEIRDTLNLDVKPEEDKSVDFFQKFDEYIELQAASRAPNTIKGIKTVRNFIQKFQVRTKFKVSFQSVGVQFGDMFMNYCFKKQKIDNDYFVKIVNVLKRYLDWCADRNLYSKDKFPVDLLGIREKENDVIFLSMEELLILTDYEFNKGYLCHARDMFCFAAFTGFRHSDAHTLLPEHIENRMVNKMTRKNQKAVKVPLNKYAQKILDRYSAEVYPLRQISNQRANEYIKHCLKEIAYNHEKGDLFKRKVLKIKVSGRKVTEIVKPLYDAITFHIARKTFITNSLMLGVNLQALQEMGAPKNQRDLKKYMKITEAYKSQVMSETWDRVE